MSIVYRNVKGAALTYVELDGNFSFLVDEIDRVEQLIDSDDILRVTPQTFLPAAQDIARANLAAASAEVVNDLVERVELLETVEPVTYAVQTPTTAMQQQLRNNADVYSKTEVDALIGGGPGGAQVTSLFGTLTEMYQEHDVSAGGTFPTANAYLTILDPGTATPTVHVGDHVVNGAQLSLQTRTGIGDTTYKGKFMVEGEVEDEILMENGRKKLFVWNVVLSCWREVV